MSKKYNAVKKRSPYLLIPIILILALLPLIVRIHDYDSKLNSYPWFYAENNTSTDFFLYYKALFFILINVFLCGYILYRGITEKKTIKFSKIFIPLALYGIFSLISSIFTEYRYFSFNGSFDQFESVLCLLGYCLTAYYTYLCINTEEDVKLVIRWWIAGIVIICLIGLSQAFSFDFYKTSLGNSLIADTSLQFEFEQGRVYMSLYNPNYVGSYVSLVLPILLALAFHNKKIIQTLFLSFLSIGLLLCLFGSQSRNGIIAFGVALLFLILMYRRELIQYWKITVPLVILFLAAIYIFNQINHNVLWNRFKNMFQYDKTVSPLTSILTNDDNVAVTYNGNDIFAQYFPEAETPFILTDGAGQPVAFTPEEDTVIFPENESTTFRVNDERFPNFTYTGVPANEEKSAYILQINTNGSIWNILIQPGLPYVYYNSLGKYDYLKEIPSALPPSFQHFGSNRGYLWSTTIPLLKDSMILGSGADTFTLTFPQNDYLGKRLNGYENMVITKPHSMYLQIAVQTGVPSLIALLVFYLIYFVSSIRLYWNCKHDTFLTQIGTGILIGSVGYMTAGIANDSTITVAPVFWALMGLGIAVNHLVKRQKTNA